ncbi:MAG: ATP-binding protein, partial [Acidimicrobiia bacterium]
MQVTLVGRGNYLRRALFLLDSKGVVLLMGPSGIGKTALCDVIAEGWRSKGGRVVEVRGTQGLQGIAFGALTLSLHVELGNSNAETLAKVTSSLAGGDSPAMVVVDDTHLLDPESAAVVSGLAQVTDIALVMAITSGESVSSDITSVWARWPDSRIDVESLGRDDVARLMTNLVGGPLDEETLDEIFALTLGYPLYVTAIAAELADRRSGSSPDSTVTME